MDSKELLKRIGSIEDGLENKDIGYTKPAHQHFLYLSESSADAEPVPLQ